MAARSTAPQMRCARSIERGRGSTTGKTRTNACSRAKPPSFVSRSIPRRPAQAMSGRSTPPRRPQSASQHRRSPRRRYSGIDAHQSFLFELADESADVVAHAPGVDAVQLPEKRRSPGGGEAFAQMTPDARRDAVYAVIQAAADVEEDITVIVACRTNPLDDLHGSVQHVDGILRNACH